ncbi:uncharacterized protein RCC_05320 [Ramularia collo-cygni]|uniref:DUF3752 domain-containing protein n=1 Tax=Ramularia collo-cygni TaxID=112498 RepID=A0A2D3VCU8_9PEZI|nr:uncharacterized protein RCC_05320 [Ramularia collo-cygni]CZT19469.1 uncharacterized protein RCC_05320 [Ramularia collo-cygni]
MSGIGAELPPHLLAKRKRQQEEQASQTSTTTSGAKRSQSPDGPEKRRKVIGPAMPPAPLEERPLEPADAGEDESSDDDDFGPSLPTGDDGTGEVTDNGGSAFADTDAATTAKPKRDDWMTMPPKQDDLAARMDPSIQRPKAFNSGKGARATNPGADDSSTWHETPEQKRKRLADEMMGIGAPSSGARPQSTKAASEHDAHRKIKEHVDKSRGPSLMEQHKQATKDTEPEDDPSKRAFDREKDMGHGGRMSSVQKKEMLNKAADFSGKFSGGSYL